jgi:zinc/manganese transport system permease protein
VAVDQPQLLWLVGISAAVLAALAVIWRPLSFASLDPDVAAARGVPTRTLSIGFMLLLGMSVAASVQVVGALLVLSLLVTPAAAAIRVTSSPALAVTLSVTFAVVSVVGGIILAVGGGLPVSPYVTSVSFVIYLVCRLIEVARRKTQGAQ